MCLSIRIGFIGFNAEPGPDTRNQTTADPDPGQTLPSTKSWIFTRKIYLKLLIVQKKQPTKLRKPFWKAGYQVYLIVYFHAPGSGSAFPTRIQDSQINANPDPQHCQREYPVRYSIQGLVQNPKVLLSFHYYQTNGQGSSSSLFPGPVILLYSTVLVNCLDMVAFCSDEEDSGKK